MKSAKRIAILTTSRSDFGLLLPVIRHAVTRFSVDLLVSGAHFFGGQQASLHEIEAARQQMPLLNVVPFDIAIDATTAEQQVAAVAAMQLAASHWFASQPPDLLLFLGDRWELWGVTLPAFLHGIPLAHISGGEVTEGVIDDSVRHAHSKLASLHFAAAAAYARNLSSMGEEDWRISVVGECGLDVIHQADIASDAEIQQQFGVDLTRDTLLVTYHPSTLESATPVAMQIHSLLAALQEFPELQIVFTSPAAEQGADIVLAAIQGFVQQHDNSRLVPHFGRRNYLAVMRRTRAVVGNSSSGIVEAASFGVPALNIGARQQNRLAAESVLHLPYVASEIAAGLRQVLAAPFQVFARQCPNPYDPFLDGNNALRIVQAIDHALERYSCEQLRRKRFDTTLHADDWNSLLGGLEKTGFLSETRRE